MRSMKVLGTMDINPVPVAAPAPLPAPVAGDAAMVITPYFSSSTSRSSRLGTSVGLKFASKQSYLFVASTLFANGKNSGLASLGHLLEVTSATPAVCSVSGVATWDRTGGIYTRATVNGLTVGTCTVLWRFLGSPGRAATSTTMNVEFNR